MRLDPTFGPYLIAVVVLFGAGVTKVVKPTETARALHTAGLPVGSQIVRLLSAGEVAVALWALFAGGRIAAALVAGSYTFFGISIAYALRRRLPVRSCGCFGETDSPPTLLHLLCDLGFASVCALESWRSVQAAVPAVFHQPWHGIPLLGMVAVGAYLSYLAMAELPRLRGTRTLWAVR